MARRIENPKILLLDCNLEYKKGESQVKGIAISLIQISLTMLLVTFQFKDPFEVDDG